jgi:heme oxygenase
LTTGLADALRHGTRTLHTEVERCEFMRTLLRGQMERKAYCLLLRSLHALYASLEAALEASREHALLAGIQDPRLFRAAALARDLDTLHGPGWAGALAVQPAGQAYRLHLQTLASSQPDLLLAHAYVRYLGDLSGGQQLKRIVGRSLALPAGLAGVAFYHFGDEAETAALTAAFRKHLAQVPVSERDIGRIVIEAQDAFGRHRELFEQLAQAGLQRRPRPDISGLRET